MLKKIGGAVVSLPLLAGQAYAAVPAAAQTAMDDMKTDALAVATAFLVVAIAVAAYMWMRKPAK